MSALRTSLAWFTLVSIPAFFCALAWYTTPAREWNLWRELVIAFGSFVLVVLLVCLGVLAMVWAFKEVIFGHGQGNEP